MSSLSPTVRPLLRVAIPVAVAAVLITLALINLVVVRNYQQTAAVDDGVLWTSDGGAAVRALEVATGSPADRAGVRRGDTLQAIDGRPVDSTQQVDEALSGVRAGGAVTYAITRGVVDDLISVRL
ncbi:MAG: PDZ domain-containing protein, partial [Acidobacteria bacterium]|nr:PDZ domain-containing protein [Acidobacteriota bacterium]